MSLSENLSSSALSLHPLVLNGSDMLEKTKQVANEYTINTYNFRKKVKEFTQIYSVASANLSADERKEFNQPEWLRAAEQELLNSTSKMKRIRFDFPFVVSL